MECLVRDFSYLYHALLIAVVVSFAGCAHPQPKPSTVYYYSENETKVVDLKKQLASTPQDVAARIGLGRIYLAEGMTDNAIQEFDLALKFDPKNLPAHLLLASAIQKQRKPDVGRALKILEDTLKIFPNSAEAHLNIAQVYQQKNHEREALNHFQKALELSSEPQILLAGHLGLMSIYKNRGEDDKATLEYEAARKIYPQVGQLISEMEIKQKGAIPVIPAEEFGYGAGSHPSFETRIEHLQKTILKIERNSDDKK